LQHTEGDVKSATVLMNMGEDAVLQLSARTTIDTVPSVSTFTCKVDKQADHRPQHGTGYASLHIQQLFA
jgi:hypothetical protein